MKMGLDVLKEKRLMVGLSILLCVMALLCLCDAKVYASGANDVDYGISIDAEMLSGMGSGTYEIGVDVSSSSMDLEGIVRLAVMSSYSSAPCAFDTAVTLPKDSRKQFVVKIPEESIEYNYEDSPDVYIQVLDRKGKVLAEEKIRNLFRNEKNCLTMGILSDDFYDLTYLDLSGGTLYFFGNNYPIKLIELDGTTWADDLSGINFLVIDQYNTEDFGNEQLDALEKWVADGGVLIVGTGTYAQDTLAGLGDFLGIQYQDETENTYYHDANNNQGWDFFQPSGKTVELIDVNWRYNYKPGLNMYVSSEARGAIGVLSFALTDIKRGGYADMTDLTYQILDDIASSSSQRYQNNSYSRNMSYQGKRLLNILNNSINSLNFAGLNVIVILYVILVGPILYLILRVIKKREIYWIAVPVTALVFVILISFIGRGFQVKGIHVHSISLARADGRETKKTYLDCYGASHKEWSLKLDDTYDCVGPALSDYYYSGEDPSKYIYHVEKNGQGLSLGANPTKTFENVYFLAMGDNTETGSIDVQELFIDPGYQYKGIIVNHTGRDFNYVGVMCNNEFLLFGKLPDGEQLDISKEVPIKEISSLSGINDFSSQYMYRVMNDVYAGYMGAKPNKAASGQLAALGLATGMLYYDETQFVIGLVEDYDAAVDDRCTETSYGCLYTVINE